MTDFNDMTAPEKRVWWAEEFIKRLEELTKTDEKEVRIVIYYRNREKNKARGEYIILTENLKDVLNYMSHLKMNGLAKPLTLGMEANYLIYFASKTMKPFKDVKKEDIEEYLIGKADKSEAYKLTIKRVLKSFFRWIYEYAKEDGYPEVVKWIQCKKLKNKALPKIFTMDEIKSMIDVCDNLRDRAIISTLYDSGCRKGELLGVRIGDLVFETDYCIMNISDGKTGGRPITLTSSVPDLKAWINIHPKKNDNNATLFCSMAKNTKGCPMGCTSLDCILKVLAKRVGIEKRVFPHMFRHTRATHLASYLTEHEMKLNFGWSESSNMTSVYVHMSGRDVSNKILQISGLKPRENMTISKIPTVECWNCHETNSIGNKFCRTCHTPLNEKGIKEKEIAERFLKLMLPIVVEKIENREMDVGDLKELIRVTTKHNVPEETQ